MLAYNCVSLLLTDSIANQYCYYYKCSHCLKFKFSKCPTCSLRVINSVVVFVLTCSMKHSMALLPIHAS